MSAQQSFDFGAACSSPPAELRHFGVMDARCGLPLHSYYSSRLPPDAFAIYREAFLAERGRLIYFAGLGAR